MRRLGSTKPRPPRAQVSAMVAGALSERGRRLTKLATNPEGSMRISAMVLAGAVLMSANAPAQTPNPADFERLLVPAYYGTPRPGAFGSQWVSELTVQNVGAVPVPVFQRGCLYFCSCEVIVTCVGAGQPLQPLAPFGPAAGHLLLGDPYAPNTAIFLYTERARAGQVLFKLRVRDLSRAATSFGTESPVVRERDFRTGTTTLTNVPLDERFRAHLRIFGISSPSRSGMVRVRVFAMDGSVPLAEYQLGFGGAFVDLRGGLPTRNNIDAPYPGYAEIPNVRRALPANAVAAERVRIQIDSLTDGLEYWAFVSVTSNETQHVTTITP
jgi:hypothetical protein